MKILIRNIGRTATEDSIRKMFAAHGRLQSCTLVIDKETGKSKGFAFVEMPKPAEAKAAIQALNGKDVEGSKIRVKRAELKKGPIKKYPGKKTPDQ